MGEIRRRKLNAFCLLSATVAAIAVGLDPRGLFARDARDPPGVTPAKLSLTASPSAAAAWPAREFKREEQAEGILLEYAWGTASGKPLAISFWISKTALEESDKAFGYNKSDLETELLSREAALRREPGFSLMAAARELIAQSRYPEYIEALEAPDGSVEITAIRGAQPPRTGIESEVERLKTGLDSAWAPVKKKIRAALEKRLASYLGERGLVQVNHGIGVRYDALIRISCPLVRPIANEISAMSAQAFGGKDLDAVLSFVQQIPTRQVPDEENGRYTAGCRVPLRVLSDDGGDCDSKAVLFSAIWRCLHNYPLLLVSVPDHMLVGVAGPHGDGASVIVNHVRYTLCEVCMQVPAPAGAISTYSATCISEGQFRYKIVGPR